MREIEAILTSILNCQRIDLYLRNNILKDAQIDRLNSALIRRIKGEPLEYILRFTEFMGLRFKINKNVFIPRPETEILVQKALDILKDKSFYNQRRYKVLDIGTGCGNMAISLAKFLPQSQVIGIDISSHALKIAAENAGINKVKERVRFLKSDLFTIFNKTSISRLGRSSRFDMIISNPPYIPSNDIGHLQSEVRMEPRVALDGGPDGLKFYRSIIGESHLYLKSHGILIMEIGFNQSNSVADIFYDSQKFMVLEVIKDYNKIDRIIVARRIK
jgi:release factor glutamine methyltransferase